MKLLTITCAIGFLLIQTVRSQDSLKTTRLPVKSDQIYKAYIFEPDKKRPAKGYLVTIQDSAVFISPYENKRALNFIDPKLNSLLKFDYHSVQRMKVFNPKTIGRCILIGAVAGIIAGAIIGYASGDDTGWFALTASQKAVVGGLLGGTAGTAVGAIVGQGYVKEYLIDGEWKSLEEVRQFYQNK
jgi:hypothetical protein